MVESFNRLAAAVGDGAINPPGLRSEAFDAGGRPVPTGAFASASGIATPQAISEGLADVRAQAELEMMRPFGADLRGEDVARALKMSRPERTQERAPGTRFVL